MTPTVWIPLSSLIIAAVTLYYLVKYVGYTKQIAEEAATQNEASFKPAIIAIQTGVVTNPPHLRNIGKGPALDIEWSVLGTNKPGKISYIEAGQTCDYLPVNLQQLEHDAVISGTNKAAIRCSYKSISGRKYVSVSDYDFERGRFSTSFEM